MSSIQLTSEERVQALRRLGYAEREARFLSMAALHGGYFLRRQYDRFLQQKDGGTTAQMIEKALALKHVQVFTYEHKIHIHHLCARPFYDALGQEDNRNRRPRQPLTIKNKLMGLDFVLEHPGFQHLATEQEKRDFFTRTLEIPIATLPAKLYKGANSHSTTARYFVEKYPIFVSDATIPARPPVVSFAYVDEGTTTLSRFETFLVQYGRLLAALSQFQLIYVAATPVLFAGAAKAFEQFVRHHQRVGNLAVDPGIRRMIDYFEDRRLYEARQLAGFDRARLIKFRNERQEFSGAEYERLYTRWHSSGDGILTQIAASETPVQRPMEGTFSTHLLEHHYDLFGTLTAF